MGRPRAVDVLPDGTADNVRAVIRTVKELKGVTNLRIAHELDWDIRRVTSALVNSSELRAAKAHQILDALRSMKPKTPEIQRLIQEALPSLAARKYPQFLAPSPAVLIPTTELGALAAFLADTIAKSTDAGKARRERLQAEIFEAICRKHKELARNFVRRCLHRFMGKNAIDYKAVLDSFGYSSLYAEFFERGGKP